MSEDIKNTDIVEQYIVLKKQHKRDEEELKALETIILSSDDYRNDDRIKIVSGRTSYKITNSGYDVLELSGLETTYNVETKKAFKDFDIKTRNLLLESVNSANPLLEITTTKESIRINSEE